MPSCQHALRALLLIFLMVTLISWSQKHWSVRTPKITFYFFPGTQIDEGLPCARAGLWLEGVSCVSRGGERVWGRRVTTIRTILPGVCNVLLVRSKLVLFSSGILPGVCNVLLVQSKLVLFNILCEFWYSSRCLQCSSRSIIVGAFQYSMPAGHNIMSLQEPNCPTPVLNFICLFFYL